VPVEAVLQRAWRRTGLAAEAWLWPLSLAAGLYRLALAARGWAYRNGLRKAAHLPVPVVSVGNLAVGGMGKTPLVIALAEALAARDRRVGVLTRGYKGSHEGKGALLVSDGRSLHADPATAGDEAVFLARRLTGIPVAVGSRRAEAGRLLLDACDLDLLLLDDGFQHRALARDADVVLVDGFSPVANRRLLPRGPLRERPSALGRADLVIARFPDQASPPDLSAWTWAPVRAARTRVTGILDAAGEPAPDLIGLPVLAVAGIARPERFRDTVAGLGARVLAFVPYPDHAAYAAADADRLADRAREAGAEAVVTTQKDAVKLAPLWPAGAVPLRVVAIHLEVDDPSGAWVDALLETALARFAAREGAGAGADIASRPV
jgi:tetraacyldisaccharide 4'-kinase